MRVAGVYLLVRAMSVAVLAVLAATHHMPLLGRLTAWDGQWYLHLAEHGYDQVPGTLRDAFGHLDPLEPLAFFPLYPCLMALVAMSGVSLTAASFLISTVSGLATAGGLYRIAGRLFPERPRAGLILVALWAGAPMGIVLSMTYTEALFCAFAAWTLVGVLERNWPMAGLCCLFAGGTRSTAAVLVLVVVVAALVDARRSTGLVRWLPLAGALIAPLGLLGWWTVVAVRTGSLTGWQDLEWQGWMTRFDFGAEAWRYVRDTLVMGNPDVMNAVNVLVLLAALGLVALSVAQRLPWPVCVYSIGVVVLVIGTAGLPAAKTRFLLPAFTLLIPVAAGLANRSPRTAIAATAGFVLFGAWFSAYALTGWRYAI